MPLSKHKSKALGSNGDNSNNKSSSFFDIYGPQVVSPFLNLFFLFLFLYKIFLSNRFLIKRTELVTLDLG